MKKLINVIFALAVCSQVSFAQKANVADLRARMREKANAADEMKKEIANAARVASPADFNDTDSFGKNAKFLGSLYAGTLYVYRSCNTQILLDELGLVLAADDHCIAHNSTTPMTVTSVFDPLWQITIPARSVDNVIYPILNNTVGYDASGFTPGTPPTGNGYSAGYASLWFILRSEDSTYYPVPFGTTGDIPAAGDYDGDGKFDPTVFRPSSATWFSQRSTAGTLIQQFGANGDRPIPNAFVP